MNKQPVPTRPNGRALARLHAEEYEALERAVNASTIIGPSTTELQAAYQLGIQHVLYHLRNGFVVSS